MAPTVTESTRHRFILALDMYLQAIVQQAEERTRAELLELQPYIALRRKTSGYKSCWVLIEYANHLDIPDAVMENPVIRELGDAANDFLIWSNVHYFPFNGAHSA